MPTKLSKYRQSIFDIVAENFGNLDYLVAIANDNSISLSAGLAVGTSLEINNENLGDSVIKEVISNNGYSFNNNFNTINYITADTTEFTADTTELTADQTIWQP